MRKLVKSLSFLMLYVLVMTIIPISAHDAVTYAEWGTPVIDGTKDDVWDTAQMIEVKDVSLGESSANVATGKVWSLWDGSFLYFYAEITDPIIDSVDRDDAWNQDAVGFMLDFAYDRTEGKNYRDLGDASYAGYINVTPKSSDATKFYPEAPSIYGIDAYVSATKSYTKIVDGGYVVEVAIPLIYKTYNADDKIGYEICINNGNGNGVRDEQTVWKYADGAHGSESWQYTYNMGTLIFNAAVENVEEEAIVESASEPVTATVAVAPVTAPQTNDANFIILILFAIAGISGVIAWKKKITSK